MKTKLSVLSSLLLYAMVGNSQSVTPAVVNTAGSSSANNICSLEWSIGEIALVNTMEAPGGKFMLTNGFLQPDKLDKSTPVQLFTNDEVTILPNPTKGKLEIWISTKQQGMLTVLVHDVTGKEMYQKKVSSVGAHVVERIDLTSQPAGSYVISINLNPAQGFSPKKGAYRIVKI